MSALKDQLSILKKGPQVWNAWRNERSDRVYRKLKPGQVPTEPEINLEGADLRGLDLSGADLSMANVRNVNLGRTDLTETDLSCSDLAGTSFYGARIRDATFFESDLMGTDFYGAFMEACHFGDADLTGCNLGGTNMELVTFRSVKLTNVSFREAYIGGTEFSRLRDADGADFTKAEMDECIFVDVDLSSVRGLASVTHRGPSTIGIDTLFRSRGRVSPKFLIGAGVPSPLVVRIPDLIRDYENRFYSCFISHSSKDRQFCDRLYAHLKRTGMRIWYFPADAKWGNSVWQEIDRGVNAYDKLVVVCSKNSLTSIPVLREIERALQREVKEGREILFPIRIDNYVFEEWEHPHKSDITARVIGDFLAWRKNDKFNISLKTLVTSLSRSVHKIKIATSIISARRLSPHSRRRHVQDRRD